MRIAEKDLRDLGKIGIYQIKCLITSKLYIGHTKKSFYSRYKSHYMKLKTNNHRAYHYLQNSWNKYGSENFEFSILEVCSEENCTIREAYWIDYYKSYERKFGYNINKYPMKSPILTKESKEKMINSLKEGYKSGRISLNKGIFKQGLIVWNKGIKYQSTDHLKVPKKVTEKTLIRLKNMSIRLRNNSPNILVYDLENNFLGEWNSSKDLEEFSKTENNNFPIKSRFKGESRMEIPVKYLNSGNINKSCKTNKPYKGLIFKYKIPSEQ